MILAHLALLQAFLGGSQEIIPSARNAAKLKVPAFYDIGASTSAEPPLILVRAVSAADVDTSARTFVSYAAQNNIEPVSHISQYGCDPPVLAAIFQDLVDINMHFAQSANELGSVPISWNSGTPVLNISQRRYHVSAHPIWRCYASAQRIVSD
jgi:hypothetical protein